jgi:hypothetical protein
MQRSQTSHVLDQRNGYGFLALLGVLSKLMGYAVHSEKSGDER